MFTLQQGSSVVKVKKKTAQVVKRSRLHRQDSWSVVNPIRSCYVSPCGF